MLCSRSALAIASPTGPAPINARRFDLASAIASAVISFDAGIARRPHNHCWHDIRREPIKLDLGERLVEVGDQVLHILDSHGDAYEPLRNADLLLQFDG